MLSDVLYRIVKVPFGSFSDEVNAFRDLRPKFG